MDIGRNDYCPCGSRKKYGDCCLEISNLGHQLHLKGKNAENFVHELAKKSFLEDWCYPNPKLPNGKELCDLLIVYDNIAIIWQIKDLKLDENNRYSESEVRKNLNQNSTAKNRLFRQDIQIELENPRRGKEKFDANSISQVYMISALLGAGEDYSTFMESIKGQIIHTFTREFTEIVLGELDTIKDFIGYLRNKEELNSFNSQITLVGGEKELLGYYLMNERSFGKLKEATFIMMDEGIWDELQKKPEYIAKKEEDKISYGWDGIINRAHTSGGEYEIIARELARPDRFERRYLSKSFFDAHVKAHYEIQGDHFRRLMHGEGITYCFLFMDDDEEPRKRRTALLGTMCIIARGIFKDHKKVVGIATERKIKKSCSYDFCLTYLPEWTEKLEKKMREIQKKTKIFLNPKIFHVHEDEYPNQDKKTPP